MKEQLEKAAKQKADGIMSMNRHERRKFAKINKIPIKIAGSTTPYVNDKAKKTR